MDFLLNYKNMLQNLDINSIIIISVIFMSLAVSLAYFFSKKFIDLEIEKLETEEITFFEKIALLFSGVFMSVIIGGALISVVEFGLMYLFFSKNFASLEIEKYIIFNLSCISILVTSYAVCTPNNIRTRIIKVSDELALCIFNQIYRIVAIVFFVSLFLFLGFSSMNDQSTKIALGYLFGFAVAGYYIVELVIFRKQITCLITIDKKAHKFLSAKLFTFVQEKLTYLLTLGAILIILSTDMASHQNVEIIIFSVIEKIFGISILVVFTQSCIHWVIGYFLEKIENIRAQNGEIAEDRASNITDICDTCVIVIYTLAVCLLLFVFDVNNIILKHKVSVALSIIFVTFILHRMFKEFVRGKLDDAANRSAADYTKLKTFVPIIELLLNAVLFVFSSLMLLANLGVDILPILAALMTACTALGIAAKNVVQSFLYGIVFLLEKDLYIGEYVEIGSTAGYIEELGIRVFKLRSVSGCLHTLSYDSVRNITNYSKDYSVQTNELCIEASQSAQDVMNVLRDVGNEMKKDPEYKDKILKEVTIFGLKPFDTEGLKIVWNIKTIPDPFHLISLEFFRRLELAFRKKKINIPVATTKYIQIEEPPVA